MNASPFIKWAGGKTQIIQNIINQFPVEIDNYYEPFLGGGSVLIEFLNKLESNYIKISKKIYANDINKGLITTYTIIKTHVSELINKLTELKQNYDINTGIGSSETKQITPLPTLNENINKGRNYLYYYYRKKYNDLIQKILLNSSTDITIDEYVEVAALFIFLNKTGFRGLYRESNHKFNVPFGNYKNPSIFDKENLLRLNYLFNKYDVRFKNKSYKELKYKPKSFIYMDPPYYPEKDNSFVSYTTDGFNIDDNKKLLELVDKLNSDECQLMMSNSNTEWIRENYKNYQINTITCKRSINSKNPEAITEEVIIKNY